MGDHESCPEMSQPFVTNMWQVVTKVNGPKVNSLPTMLVTAWIAFGYMLENPSIRPVLVLHLLYGQ